MKGRMKTIYSQKLENLDKLEGFFPFVYDMLNTINEMPSGNHSEMMGKIKLIYSIIDLKDNLIDQIAMNKVALEKFKKEFIKEQEGLAQDVS